MTEPLVSTQMITYNHAPYIAQAIEGVLKQRVNFAIELVIGEDCSTDGTREIVLEYQRKYPDVIRVITSDKNVGANKNAYRTMKGCRGKYVAFCEGDDYWHHPHKLQKQVDYLESHPECGLLFADCDVHYIRGNKLLKNSNYNSGFQSPMKLSLEQIIHNEILKWTCTAVIRRDLYLQVIESDPYLYQSEKFLMGDLQLWAEVSLISEVMYIPETLATYRVLDESATRSKDPRKYWRFIKSASEIKLYLCDKHKLSENIRREVECDWCNSSLYLAFHERNIDLGMEVRTKKKKFTWKESLLYLGAKYLAIYYACRVATKVRNLIRERVKQ